MAYNRTQVSASASPAPAAPPAPSRPAGKAKFRPVGDVKAKAASDWTVGEVYCGFLISSKTVKTQHKDEACIYTLRNSNEDGDVLDDTQDLWESGGLKLDRVALGQLVRIEALGEEMNPKSKRKYLKFDIQIADQFISTQQTQQ